MSENEQHSVERLKPRNDLVYLFRVKSARNCNFRLPDLLQLAAMIVALVILASRPLLFRDVIYSYPGWLSVLMAAAAAFSARLFSRRQIKAFFKATQKIIAFSMLAVAWLAHAIAKSFIHDITGIPKGTATSTEALFTAIFTIALFGLGLFLASIVGYVLACQARQYQSTTRPAFALIFQMFGGKAQAEKIIKRAERQEPRIQTLERASQTAFFLSVSAVLFLMTLWSFVERHDASQDSSVKFLVNALDFENHSYCRGVKAGERSILVGEGRVCVAPLQAPTDFKFRQCNPAEDIAAADRQQTE